MTPYVAYKDDLSFVEEINQELELNMPSNEGIVKRFVFISVVLSQALCCAW